MTVVSVGGGGGNVLNSLVRSGFVDARFLAINTDAQDLGRSLAGNRYHLGGAAGAGGNPEVGREVALNDIARLRDEVGRDGVDIVFVLAGMGGGTGTGAAPIVCGVARELGALTIGMVTMPFASEGSMRSKRANEGLGEISKHTDALVVVENQRVLPGLADSMTMGDAYQMIDRDLIQMVKGVVDLLVYPGQINIDRADVRSVLGNADPVCIRVEESRTPMQAMQGIVDEGARLTITPLKGATSVIVNFTAAYSVTMNAQAAAMEVLNDHLDPEASIKVGYAVDDTMGDKVRVTVIASGPPVPKE